MRQIQRSSVNEIPHYWDVRPNNYLTIQKLLDNQDQERAKRRMELFNKLRMAHQEG